MCIPRNQQGGFLNEFYCCVSVKFIVTCSAGSLGCAGAAITDCCGCVCAPHVISNTRALMNTITVFFYKSLLPNKQARVAGPMGRKCVTAKDSGCSMCAPNGVSNLSILIK